MLAECPIQSLAISDDEAEESSNKNYETSETVQEGVSRPESPHDAFKSLKVLNLNSTNLSSWDDIERLAQFPALQCVRILVSIRTENCLRDCYQRVILSVISQFRSTM